MNLIKHIKAYDALLNFTFAEPCFCIEIKGKQIFAIEVNYSTYAKIFHPFKYLKNLSLDIKQKGL